MSHRRMFENGFYKDQTDVISFHFMLNFIPTVASSVNKDCFSGDRAENPRQNTLYRVSQKEVPTFENS